MPAELDRGTLASIASVIAAFCAAMLFFRIQRELFMRKRKETVWIPVADWFLVLATIISLLFVILPIITWPQLVFPAAAAGAATILVAGYVFAILGHYQIFFKRKFVLFGELRTEPRNNPELSELFFVALSCVAAASFFFWRLFFVQ